MRYNKFLLILISTALRAECCLKELESAAYIAAVLARDAAGLEIYADEVKVACSRLGFSTTKGQELCRKRIADFYKAYENVYLPPYRLMNSPEVQAAIDEYYGLVAGPP